MADGRCRRSQTGDQSWLRTDDGESRAEGEMVSLMMHCGLWGRSAVGDGFVVGEPMGA